MDKRYDFKAARDRIQALRSMYLTLKVSQQLDGTWNWFLTQEIAELEAEMQYMRMIA